MHIFFLFSKEAMCKKTKCVSKAFEIKKIGLGQKQIYRTASRNSWEFQPFFSHPHKSESLPSAFRLCFTPVSLSNHFVPWQKKSTSSPAGWFIRVNLQQCLFFLTVFFILNFPSLQKEESFKLPDRYEALDYLIPSCIKFLCSVFPKWFSGRLWDIFVMLAESLHQEISLLLKFHLVFFNSILLLLNLIILKLACCR